MVKTLSSRLQKASQWQHLKPEGLTEPDLKNSGRPIMCPESPFINAPSYHAGCERRQAMIDEEAIFNL